MFIQLSCYKIYKNNRHKITTSYQMNSMRSGKNLTNPIDRFYCMDILPNEFGTTVIRSDSYFFLYSSNNLI
jgi:hypothetical protein